MCLTCGCSDDDSVSIVDPITGDHKMIAHEQAHLQHYRHSHGDGPHSNHDHDSVDEVAVASARSHDRNISLEQAILGKNSRIAAQNRGYLAANNILALNLVSSPGSGKTTLLERTIRDLGDEFEISVIEGDQETVNDAERIRSTGCKAIQVNTGTGCHLEAEMIKNALFELDPAAKSVVFIENVGNLVCPALFDLGERSKVSILSVTEGEDKPAKYPHMFRASDVMILNKIDLLPYLDFDVDRCIEYALQVNSAIQIFRVSATTGEGMPQWYDWLRKAREI